MLQKREDFVRLNRALRAQKDTVAIQALKRPAAAPDTTADASQEADAADLIRVGFTATKKIGSAVIRNRAKRRLREVAASLLPRHGLPGCEYVFIARHATASAPWPLLLDEAQSALVRLNADLLAGKTRSGRPRSRRSDRNGKAKAS